MEEEYLKIGTIEEFDVCIKVPKNDLNYNHRINWTKSVEEWSKDFRDAYKILDGIRAFRRNF